MKASWKYTQNVIGFLLVFASFEAHATGLLKNSDQFISAAMAEARGVITSMKKKPTPPPPPFEVSDKPQIYVKPFADMFTFPHTNDPTSPDFKADANSPAVWEDGKLVLFNSAGHPWRSEGDNIRAMGLASKVAYLTEANGGRWLEAVVRDDDTGNYYGYYHIEPRGMCNGKTAPQIGAVVSSDQGRSWKDLGIIMEGMGINNCNTPNHYFIGGHGDFSVALDREKRVLYFFFSTYEDEWDQQGISVAQMDWSARNNPVGRVYKYWKGSDGFTQPGLKGAVSAIKGFEIKASWHDVETNAYWGPSVHWNTHLNMWVMLTNHAIRSDETWKQEGIYASFSANIEDPNGWSEPKRIVEGGVWYPQVIGTQIGSGTDKEAGCSAYFFVGGESRSMFYFIRPGESTYCGQ